MIYPKHWWLGNDLYDWRISGEGPFFLWKIGPDNSNLVNSIGVVRHYTRTWDGEQFQFSGGKTELIYASDLTEREIPSFLRARIE